MKFNKKFTNFSTKNLNLARFFPSQSVKSLFYSFTIIIYGAILGIFISGFILFLILALIHNYYVFVNFAFYLLLGVIVYAITFGVWWILSKKCLKFVNVVNEQKAKKLLQRTIVGGSVTYLLIAWFLMIMIGTFQDFNLRFINYPTISVFSANNNYYQTQINGFILFYITIGLTILLTIAHVLFWRFHTKANTTFNIRRKIVAKVRSEAQRSV